MSAEPAPISKTTKKKKLTEVPASSMELSSIEGRTSDELVVAFVGAVGSGVTKSAELLEALFRSEYNYQVHRFKISELIEDASRTILKKEIPKHASRDERIAELQRIGSSMRHDFGEDFLAQMAVDKIAVWRASNDGYRTVEVEAKGGNSQATFALPRRVVHIIDSLKNPAEEELLRSVYGDTLWVIGVFAPDEVRRSRMLKAGLDDVQLHKIMNRDAEEGPEYGQKVRKTIHLADFFVRNDGQNDSRLTAALSRYLELLFNIKVHSPTQDELAMFQAASASSGSACLSRQVGAVIYSDRGELIGTGSNDVPKAGGGLYRELDGPGDHRCFKWDGKICHNDDQKNKIYQEIFDALKGDGLTSASMDAVRSAVEKTRVRDLIEFSRAVHAETEAIISVARGTKAGLVGSTLYSTTFPCHSCARHIVAAGIMKVVYVEPYTKSLAGTLHSDAIDLQNLNDKRVQFVQYEGVAPKNMLKLFKNNIERKIKGKLEERSPRDARPVFPIPLDGFSTREQIVVSKLRAIEENPENATKIDPDGKQKSSSKPAQLSL